ncbi:MAG: hypothetical protein GX973_02970 [Firmicutes bacterium]|nr:hypothetical protein [Bacillota bacterium]
MIQFRKLKSVAAVLLAVLILLTGLGSTGYAARPGRHQKYETVYAHLDHDGSVLKQSVINRINYSGVGRVEDYGEYTSIKALNLNLLPSISGSRIIWDVPAYEPGVLFYEGVTSRELPVDIAIDYFLNGHPVTGEGLAGQEGKVTIKIKIENRLREIREIEYKDSRGEIARKPEEVYVPLMVQVTIPVDLERFHYIESEDDAIKVVSGDTMNVSFGTFPFPKEELTLELVGKKIELEPITFAVIPMMPPIPEVEIEEELDELYTGVKSFNKAVSELEGMKGSLGQVSRLVDGVDELNRGGQKLVKNSDDLLEGLWDYVFGVAEIARATGVLSGGLDRLAEGCSQLDDGAAELARGTEELATGLQEMAVNGRQLVMVLKVLAGFLEQLAENEEICELLDEYGLSGLVERLPEISEGVEELEEGLNRLANGSRKLAGGADRLSFGIGQVADNTKELADGAKELHDGTKKLSDGGRHLYKGTADYLHGVDKLSGGLGQINDGMREMDREMSRLKKLEMLGTKGESLDSIEYSLQQSLEELRLGQSTADEMELLAEQYVSFMDNQHNRDSSVQFILKTKGIEYKLNEPVDNIEKPKKGFWQRLIELFGFRS